MDKAVISSKINVHTHANKQTNNFTCRWTFAMPTNNMSKTRQGWMNTITDDRERELYFTTLIYTTTSYTKIAGRMQQKHMEFII